METRDGWRSISAAPSPTSCLDWQRQAHQRKVLTTPRAPEEGGDGGHGARSSAGRASSPADLGLVIHGTTLATNAIIERKGAQDRAGRHRGLPRRRSRSPSSSRFEQYDIFIDKPPPLVPRDLRFARARAHRRADGDVLLPLDEAAVRGARAGSSQAQGIESGRHRLPARLSPTRRTSGARARSWPRRCPASSITLSSEVSPEIREYERSSTAVANAYVQPLMDALSRPARRRAAQASGFACPLYLMTSGGGLTALETARALPDPPGRIGPGRRRDPGGAASRAAVRPRQGAVASTWAARRPRSA